MSTFLPYRETDGNIYIYEWETLTPYKTNEVVYANNIFYRVENNYTSGTSAEDDFIAGDLSQFNKLDMDGALNTIGPVNANVGRGYGTNDVSLMAPDDHFVVGYRLYGSGANNYPDGGSTGSRMQHWLVTKQVKKD